MVDHETVNSTGELAGQSSQIRQEYENQIGLFHCQPALVQRFIEAQARLIADALVQKLPQVRFSLPDQVVCQPGQAQMQAVATEFREQLAGGLMDRLTRNDLRSILRLRLADLESNNDAAVTTAASLLRYAIVTFIVHHLLPAGRSINYANADGEEIPTLPVWDEQDAASAITAATDAIAEEGPDENERGELLVPYVPYARRFYIPQWVAFDDKGKLLVGSVNEAEAHLASMQHFLELLHTAVSIAPYIVADETYQQKRYGMLGQLINQGRTLAGYETHQIIRTIKRRAAAQDLNRGLSLSLPYFDDQALFMRTHDFEVIPAGRIMFVPAFVVRAAREEQVKVAQDTRLSPSTRKYLLIELKKLEQAFEPAAQSGSPNKKR